MKHPFLVTEEDRISLSYGSNYTDQLALREYLLVLRLPAELRNKLKAVKENFAQEYDCPSAKRSSTHIALVKFHQFDMMEFKVVTKLQLLAKTLSPFIVELKNFGSFPTHSIYVNVAATSDIQTAVKTMRQAQHLMKASKELKPYFITEPHTVIARKLLPWQYEKGWLALSNQDFSGRFIATQVVLLKRKAGSKERYEKVNIFPFKGEQLKIEQGALF